MKKLLKADTWYELQVTRPQDQVDGEGRFQLDEDALRFLNSATTQTMQSFRLDLVRDVRGQIKDWSSEGVTLSRAEKIQEGAEHIAALRELGWGSEDIARALELCPELEPETQEPEGTEPETGEDGP